MLANDEFQHEILVIEMRTLVIFFFSRKKKLGLICSDDYRVKHKKKPQLISFDFLQKLDRDCDFFSPCSVEKSLFFSAFFKGRKCFNGI